ncbi:GNAT family N-acetyltransferase [Streptomyces fragilis]|uniref:GNAT family N-acetyltransferase n=1 Tax=Streptomyces fragilis TaxID=67301 RepID=A0ABV2YLP1_9ACTN|nr:GNAT family N-acetyltransferase [Streptomyces fragilis]
MKPGTTELAVSEATPQDLEGVLKLQYLCYQSEAERYDDHTLPPLTQDLAGLREDREAGVLLVVRLGSEVVGSVRGRRRGDAFHIGRLVVHPRLQRRGLGSRLLAAVEERAGDAAWLELFTGDRSTEQLALYTAAGYRPYRTERVAPHLGMVHLRKEAAAGLPSVTN